MSTEISRVKQEKKWDQFFKKNLEKDATISDFGLFASFATSDYFAAPSISIDARHFIEPKINFLLNIWPIYFLNFFAMTHDIRFNSPLPDF